MLLSTYPRQRIPDQHIDHAGAAEAGVHEDHSFQLFADLVLQ